MTAIEVTFSAVVTIQVRTRRSAISVGETERAASYASGDNSTTLRFSHQITADDDGATTAVLIADGFDTSAGSSSATPSDATAVLDFDVAADSDRTTLAVDRKTKINRIRPTVNSLTATCRKRSNIATPARTSGLSSTSSISLEPDLAAHENVRRPPYCAVRPTARSNLCPQS